MIERTKASLSLQVIITDRELSLVWSLWRAYAVSSKYASQLLDWPSSSEYALDWDESVRTSESRSAASVLWVAAIGNPTDCQLSCNGRSSTEG